MLVGFGGKCLAMPKKAFQDGPCASPEEAEKLVAAWDSHSSLRDGAMQGKSLLQDRLGKPAVLPNLGNIGYNSLVLQEIAKQMCARKRLSSEPIEVLVVATNAWYSKYQAFFAGDKGFNAQVSAFRDAWILHKMFTLLRGKVVKGEKPKDSCLRISKLCLSYVVKID